MAVGEKRHLKSRNGKKKHEENCGPCFLNEPKWFLDTPFSLWFIL